jgi:hypothetical protein
VRPARTTEETSGRATGPAGRPLPGEPTWERVVRCGARPEREIAEQRIERLGRRTHRGLRLDAGRLARAARVHAGAWLADLLLAGGEMLARREALPGREVLSGLGLLPSREALAGRRVLAARGALVG